MRITSINLAGASKTRLGNGTPGLPNVLARISREDGSDHITVEILSPGSERTHHVQADCEEDVWSMAECLQYQLDGHKGTNSMIHDYVRILQHFAD